MLKAVGSIHQKRNLDCLKSEIKKRCRVFLWGEHPTLLLWGEHLLLSTASQHVRNYDRGFRDLCAPQTKSSRFIIVCFTALLFGLNVHGAQSGSR